MEPQPVISKPQPSKLPVLILTIFLIFSLGLSGFLFYQNTLLQKQVTTLTAATSTTLPRNTPPSPTLTTKLSSYQNNDFSFEYPVGWQEKPQTLYGSGWETEITDPNNIYALTVTKRGNYNNGTGKPYASLQEYANMSYPGTILKLDGVEGMQYLPRAGSENVNEVLFFSKDKKAIYAINLTTNAQNESTVQAGKTHFSQILSTFQFLNTNPAADKTIMGHITKVTTKNNQYFVDVDEVQWLTDEPPNFAASKACIEAGSCRKEDCYKDSKLVACAWDGYFVKDDDHLTKTYALNPNTTITTVITKTVFYEETRDLPTHHYTLEQFLGRFNTKDQEFLGALWNIVLINNQVTQISEQYRP